MTRYLCPPGAVIVISRDGGLRSSLAPLVAARQFSVHAFGSVTGFLDAWTSCGPECVLLDVCRSAGDEVGAIRSLRCASVFSPVVVLSAYEDVAATVNALKCGAADYVVKPFCGERLQASLGRAIDLDARRRASGARAASSRALYSALTEIERAVLRQLIEGKLNKQIAAQLSCSERTVKAHRARLMQKLQCESVACLVRLWMQLEPFMAVSIENSPAVRMRAA